jgi:hypothetical protein
MARVRRCQVLVASCPASSFAGAGQQAREQVADLFWRKLAGPLAHAHHGHLYKLHLDHDVDVNDSEEDSDEIDEVFGKEHHEGDEIDLDDRDDD